MTRELSLLGSRFLFLSRMHRQQEGALARNSKDTTPFRACFLFDKLPSLYNWNANWGFSQGTGWELMDQSALPRQCFYHWLLECVWWKESDFFRQRNPNCTYKTQIAFVLNHIILICLFPPFIWSQALLLIKRFCFKNKNGHSHQFEALPVVCSFKNSKQIQRSTRRMHAC